MKYEFEHQWGGQDTWYTKSKRWAGKQKFPINHLALGTIEWLYKHWVDGKVNMEMDSVDKQTELILKEWEEDAAKYYEQRRKPSIVEAGVFGEEGWSISMSNENIDRGPEESESSLGTSGDEKRLQEILPDPWDGDWNDVQLGLDYEFRKSARNVEN